MLNLITTLLLAPLLLDGQDTFVMDGRFGDWVNVAIVRQDEEGLVRAVRVADDPHFVYLQIDLESPRTLQGLQEELRIELDFDGSNSTGFVGIEGLKGVDGIIAFSPLDAETGKARAGSAFFGTDARGTRIDIPIGPGLGVVALPTHGSKRFEIRLNRLPAFRLNAFQAQIITRNADGVTDKTTIFDHVFKTDKRDQTPHGDP